MVDVVLLSVILFVNAIESLRVRVLSIIVLIGVFYIYFSFGTKSSLKLNLTHEALTFFFCSSFAFHTFLQFTLYCPFYLCFLLYCV